MMLFQITLIRMRYWVFDNYLSASQSQANRYLQRLGRYIYFSFFPGFHQGIYYKKLN